MAFYETLQLHQKSPAVAKIAGYIYSNSDFQRHRKSMILKSFALVLIRDYYSH